jgi:cytochrome c-type biogenesis protein CcmH
VRSILLASLLIFFLAGKAFPQETTTNPLLERRTMALAEELRCLVCQNQTLADSHADLALDLKNRIREQLRAGRSEQEVLDFMVARYGDFVLYRPPLRARTALLWAGPFILLALALLGLAGFLKGRKKEDAEDTSSEKGEAP